jgi:hypothetical protein
VIGVRDGVITREEAYARYSLSEEELAGWEAAYDRSGVPGLRRGIRHPSRLLAKKIVPQPLAHELG